MHNRMVDKIFLILIHHMCRVLMISGCITVTVTELCNVQLFASYTGPSKASDTYTQVYTVSGKK